MREYVCRSVGMARGSSEGRTSLCISSGISEGNSEGKTSGMSWEGRT